jgi:hypothetical protein
VGEPSPAASVQPCASVQTNFFFARTARQANASVAIGISNPSMMKPL